MPFELTILGSGSARPTATRWPSAHALQCGKTLYLVDCGEGTQMQMARARLAPERVGAIFLSHLHADHVLGVFGLLATLSMTSRTAPLYIHAHRDFESILRSNFDFFVSRQNFELVFCPFEASAGLIFENGDLTVSTVPLDHRVPTCGFVIREKPSLPNIRKEKVEEFGLHHEQVRALKRGESVVAPDGRVVAPGQVLYRKHSPSSYAYMSDTRYVPAIAQYFHGVDLLYHEATYLHDLAELAKEVGHSTARQAAEVAALAEAKTLVIGHYSARYTNLEPLLEEARSFFPNTSLAREGDLHTIG